MLSRQTTRAINLDVMHRKLFRINVVIYTYALAILPGCPFFVMTPKLLICKFARSRGMCLAPDADFSRELKIRPITIGCWTTKSLSCFAI